MATPGTDTSKPWVVVLGGCGFIGRNLVEYLVSEDVVEGVRVVDKVPPQMAWLNKRHSHIFSDPRVEFDTRKLTQKSGRPFLYRVLHGIKPEPLLHIVESHGKLFLASCAKALSPREGCDTWELVVNCGGETKPGQTDAIYKEGILTLSMNCAREAARLKVHHYVEISSSCIYPNTKKPQREEDSTEAWTVVGKWKLQVEEGLRELSDETGLRYTILRPATVYGEGDFRNLTPRLLVAAIYGRLRETLTLMWSHKLSMATVCVWDLCAAVWLVGRRPECQGQVYHVVDHANTTQESIIKIVASIFNIKYDYWSIADSLFAKNDLPSVLEELNDKHLSAWASACRADGIENTPLDPTMTEEMISGNYLSIDGSKLRGLGFTCRYPAPTVDKLKEVVEDFVKMGVFPRCLLP